MDNVTDSTTTDNTLDADADAREQYFDWLREVEIKETEAEFEADYLAEHSYPMSEAA